MRKIAVCALTALFLITASGYMAEAQKISSTDSPGFMKIQDNIYKVVFSGDTYVGETRASDFAMLYLSDVTQQNGYNYFVPLQQKSDNKGDSYKTPIGTQGVGLTAIFQNPNYTYGTFNGATYYNGGQTYRFSDPNTIIFIACFKEKPQNVPTIVYDAQQLKNTYRKKYNLK